MKHLITEPMEDAEMAHSKQTSSRQLSAQAKRSELLPSSTLYPSRLTQLSDVPKKLYALGNVHALQQPSIAIVGARKATPYGLRCAEHFAKLAASKGLAVVSGGAIGCDLAAHKGALAAGGTTVVVLGSGADVVYPLRAKELFLEVLDTGGVLLSEAPWGSAPLRWNFSKRNRIIAALGKATLIVEAGLPSGTFQTADHTLSLGNEVLVVPGPIFSQESKGSNRLLQQGALPVVDEESYLELLESIFCLETASSASPARGSVCVCDAEETEEKALARSPEEIKNQRFTERILASLAASPMTIDELATALEKSSVEVVQKISQLEISASVERLRDGRYMSKLARSG